MRVSGSLGLKNSPKYGVVIDHKSMFGLSRLHIELSEIDESCDSTYYLAFKREENCAYRLTNSSIREEFVSLFDFQKWLAKNNEQIELAIFYDENVRELFLFRNIFGIVPLYYIHLPGDQLHFSTHLSFLLEIKEVRNHISINYNWIKNYLNFAGDSAYSTETIYSQIKLLYPGHYLHVSKDVFKEELLTNFDTARYSGLQTLGEFGEEFRHLFSKSVLRHVLSSGKTISAELSGGLDSSSVCAMTRHLFPDRDLHTFYLDVPGVIVNERHFATDAAAEMNTAHHMLKPDTNALNLMISHTALKCYPERSISGPSVFSPQMKLARDLGLKTMLSGHDGDGIVGLGIEYPQILYKQRQFALLRDTFTDRANNYSFTDRYPNWDKFSVAKKKRLYSRDFLINQALLKLNTDASTSWLNLLVDSMRILGPLAGVSEIIIKGAYKFLRKTTREDLLVSDHIFRPEFYENFHDKVLDHSIVERLSNNLAIGDPYAIPDIFLGPSLTVPEDCYALKDHYGVTAKFPFFDKSLFELCIATPQSIKFDNGRLRGHMREGMRGILPEKIRTRVSKSRFGNYSKTAALELYQQAREILNESHEIWSIIDKKKFDRLVQVYLKSNTAYSRANFLLIRTISLAVWLDIFKARQRIIV